MLFLFLVRAVIGRVVSHTCSKLRFNPPCQKWQGMNVNEMISTQILDPSVVTPVAAMAFLAPFQRTFHTLTHYCLFSIFFSTELGIYSLPTYFLKGI